MTDPIGRIEEALRGLGAEHDPPVGWEARVMSAITATAPPKPTSPKWWLFAVPTVSVAAVAAIVLLWPWPQGFAFVVTFDRDPVVVRRGESPHAGDVAHAKVTGGGPYHAVWIYRDDGLVTACPGGDATQCRTSNEETTANVTLTLGSYLMVALTSSSPIPPPRGKLDPDLARALDAGAKVARSRVLVR